MEEGLEELNARSVADWISINPLLYLSGKFQIIKIIKIQKLEDYSFFTQIFYVL